MRLGRHVAALRRGLRPVRLGSLDSTVPFGSRWGFDRGTPVDRWYIERFLAEHATDIAGRVLEVKDSGYTRRFGRGVSEAAVVDIDAGNDLATHVADLAGGSGLPDAAFDCFILTQTLQYVFDVRTAVATAHRVLTPGGVLLVTLPTASRVTDPPLTDYWRFTPASAQALFDERFGAGTAVVRGRGNVLAQVAFLEGLAAEDVGAAQLGQDDRRFPLIVTVRAVKAR